jgi:hypothetical protein
VNMAEKSWSVPCCSVVPRSEDNPPPAKSARMEKPAEGAKRSWAGVEFDVGMRLFVFYESLVW